MQISIYDLAQDNLDAATSVMAENPFQRIRMTPAPLWFMLYIAHSKGHPIRSNICPMLIKKNGALLLIFWGEWLIWNIGFIVEVHDGLCMDRQKPRLLTAIADEKTNVRKQPLDSNGLIMFDPFTHIPMHCSISLWLQATPRLDVR